MRDPWFPIALMLIVLLTAWLGILGPLPDDFFTLLEKWQTLAAATVASIAAYVSIRNTTHTLRQAGELEQHRRIRKHAAVRALLPLVLAQVTAYAARSARELNELVSKCEDELLPAMTVPESVALLSATITVGFALGGFDNKRRFFAWTAFSAN